MSTTEVPAPVPETGERPSAERKTLARLRELEERFEAFFRASPVAMGIATFDDGRIIDINEKHCELYGYTREESLGRTFRELGMWVDLRERKKVIDALHRKGSVRGVEVRLKHRSGEIRHALLSVEKVELSGQPVMLAMLADITERKRVEEERDRLLLSEREARGRLEILSRRLVSIQEAERREIARELHDEIGQQLTGLKLLVESLPGRPGAKQREIRKLVGELLGRVRALSTGLRPSLLDDLGLLPALLSHIESYTARTGVAVDFRHTGVKRRFSPETETAAFRIVQEGLTNVARHAGVRRAAVKIRADRRGLRLGVSDRGRGFDPAAVQAGSSNGLNGMRERAWLLGGTLTIETAPRRGTTLSAWLPAGGSAAAGPAL